MSAITVGEAAKRKGCTPRTVRNFIYRGKLKRIEKYGMLFVLESQLRNIDTRSAGRPRTKNGQK